MLYNIFKRSKSWWCSPFQISIEALQYHQVWFCVLYSIRYDFVSYTASAIHRSSAISSGMILCLIHHQLWFCVLYIISYPLKLCNIIRYDFVSYTSSVIQYMLWSIATASVIKYLLSSICYQVYVMKYYYCICYQVSVIKYNSQKQVDVDIEFKHSNPFIYIYCLNVPYVVVDVEFKHFIYIPNYFGLNAS